MSAKAFRAELEKVMPGYKWTVHKSNAPRLISATGIRSSGFNRLSTVRVTRIDGDRGPQYEVKSAGYGTKAPWGRTISASTLARSLRILQDHYEASANSFRKLASDLQQGRKAEGLANG